MNENEYGNYLLFLITSTSISCALIILIRKLNVLERSAILWVGRNTLCFIGFNYVCRDLATELYYYIPVLKNYPIHWAISFLLTFVLCLIVDLLYNYLTTKIERKHILMIV